MMSIDEILDELPLCSDLYAIESDDFIVTVPNEAEIDYDYPISVIINFIKPFENTGNLPIARYMRKIR